MLEANNAHASRDTHIAAFYSQILYLHSIINFICGSQF